MTERMRLADATIRPDSMPVTGRDVIVRPGDDERVAIAAALGISEVRGLEVKLHAVRFRGGIRVTGRLVAEITQPSVVTLESITQAVAEPIDRIFLPGREKDFAAAAGAEVFVDLEGDELPDHFDGPEADLSDLIVETLALGIDLYPRGENEALDPIDDGAKDPADLPFAVLKALKDKDR